MFYHPVFMSERSYAVDLFNQLRESALLSSILHRIFAKGKRLERFSCVLASHPETRRYIGTREIEVKRISGSVGREGDFDIHFRPLSDHLRERWVKIFLLAGIGSWEPIRALEIGGRYFVEDGHHRVSVATALGMPTLRAEVWEVPYSIQPLPPSHCGFPSQPPARCPLPSECSC